MTFADQEFDPDTRNSDENEGGRRADIVTEAVKTGVTEKYSRSIPLRVALTEARELLAQARNDGAYRASLPRILDLIKQQPSAEDLQVTAARLLMEAGDYPAAMTAWDGILQRFPDATEPFRMMIRMTVRIHGVNAGVSMLNARFPDPSLVVDEPGLFTLALGYEEVGEPAKAEDYLRKLTHSYPGARLGWRHLIRLQEARGGLISAQHSAASAVQGCKDEEFSIAYARLTREINVIESLSPGTARDDRPYTVMAMNAVIDNLLAARKARNWTPRRRLGSTILLTGSLGAGGAERQLVTTAISLNQASRDGSEVGGYDILGPISVVCRSLTAKRGNDFFLERLNGEGIRVTDYGKLPPFGGQLRYSRAKQFSEVIELLSPRIKEGVKHLVDFLRHEAVDVVHIWQDGMVLAAGLAALMADVPRIVLAVRTLPPIDRVNRWRMELEPIYRALLSAPGVVMTANSNATARRYEHWLGMASGTVPVVHNGVTRLDETPGPTDELTWQSFAKRTEDADFTVGAVMRLDQNKRPLDWLAVAERLHQKNPRARFVIVGDGALRQEAHEYAHRLGIGDRVLFTGVSGSVGYWLMRMDILMLLSRFEGMPNVLIEAQLAGRPVITTPAGGAPETVLHGQTGWVLSSAETVDVEEAADRLFEIAGFGPGRRLAMNEAARAWAEQSFSVEAMLDRTVRVFMAPYSHPMLPAR
jgi:glycosyltransferase involved in cell wall biosynthesis